MASRSSPKTVGTLGEFELIRLFQQTLGTEALPSPQGIGDDCASLEHIPGFHWLISNDLLIESIHFDPRFASYREIGTKAALANVSDIAAMGGIPRFLLVGIAIPKSMPTIHVRAFYDGIKAVCRTYDIKVIGGDTCASGKDVFISLTIIGHVKKGQALTRGGARVGDLIFVTGTLGDAGAGLHLLKHGSKQQAGQLPKSVVQFLKQRHLHPVPRIQLGRRLSEKGIASAAIDLSDGLSGDLAHLCRESHVGAIIDVRNIPISTQCLTYSKRRRKSPITFALQGGEDYELLFTIPPQKEKQLHRIAVQSKTPITCIGEIGRHHSGIQIRREDGLKTSMPMTSYDHFHH